MTRKGMRKTRPTGLIRYPGGKSKLLNVVNSRLQPMFADLGPNAEFREPFLGGGSVALSLLAANADRKRAWLNDADPAMAALWDSVINNPTSLRVYVQVLPEAMRLAPDIDFYRDDKDVLLGIQDPRDVLNHPAGLIAAMKLAVHQMSYSGVGTRARPMSNRLCRYNVNTLCSRIETFSEILSSVRLRHGTCTCLDFEELFRKGKAFFYLDPPYVKAGPDLYQVAFTEADHERLAKKLRGEKRPWLLSYDSHPLVHRLYGGWSRIEDVQVRYSVNTCGKKSEKKSELLITNFS